MQEKGSLPLHDFFVTSFSKASLTSNTNTLKVAHWIFPFSATKPNQSLVLDLRTAGVGSNSVFLRPDFYTAARDFDDVPSTSLLIRLLRCHGEGGTSRDLRMYRQTGTTVAWIRNEFERIWATADTDCMEHSYKLPLMTSCPWWYSEWALDNSHMGVCAKGTEILCTTVFELRSLCYYQALSLTVMHSSQ